jgi:hypothetical protein
MIPPCHVITLNEDLGEQGEILKGYGLNPILFPGVDARKDEHIPYVDSIDPMCLEMCPKSVIGCGLSHILLARKIYYTGASIALILEDDAYPTVTNLEDEITKVLNEVPDDWEIIRLHCDTHCVDGTNKVGQNGSTAAYLINRKGMEIMMNTKVNNHIDWQQNTILNIYKSKINLFWTDEKRISTNRIQTTTFLSGIMDVVSPITSGEKTWDDKLSYKTLRIPFTNTEINAITMYFIIFLVAILIFLYFYSR